MSYRKDFPEYYVLDDDSVGVQAGTITVGVLIFFAFMFLIYMMWSSCARSDLSDPEDDGYSQLVVTNPVSPNFVVIEANSADEQFRVMHNHAKCKDVNTSQTFSSESNSNPGFHGANHQAIPTAPAYEFAVNDQNAPRNNMTIHMDMPPPYSR